MKAPAATLGDCHETTAAWASEAFCTAWPRVRCLSYPLAGMPARCARPLLRLRLRLLLLLPLLLPLLLASYCCKCSESLGIGRAGEAPRPSSAADRRVATTTNASSSRTMAWKPRGVQRVQSRAPPARPCARTPKRKKGYHQDKCHCCMVWENHLPLAIAAGGAAAGAGEGSGW